jgi:uncharacterized membrane protein
MHTSKCWSIGNYKVSMQASNAMARVLYASTGAERKPIARTQGGFSMREARHGEKGALEWGLGLFSIGLGAAQILAPRGVARLIGARGDRSTRATMRAFGLRELTAGLGILGRSRPSGFLWSRVLGDGLDLAALGRVMSSRCTERGRTAMAIAAVGGVALLDLISAVRLSRAGAGEGEQAALPGGVSVTEVINVNKSPEEVYRFWRNLENLPRFMAHLETVESTGDRRSRWVARAIAGKKVEWEAEILEDRPGQLLSWRSIEGADVPNRGSVRFLPATGGRGTIVRVELAYDPPGGKLAATIAKLFGKEPGQQVKGDLRRFKQVLETGEVVHSDASIHSGMHPARPSEKAQVAPPRREPMISGQPVTPSTLDRRGGLS